AAAEMSGFVDDLLGAVNAEAFVPVILGIEQRSSRTTGGRKDFSVPFLELPEGTATKVMGALSAGADEFGTAGELTGGAEARAITAGPAKPNYVALALAAPDRAALRMLWNQAMAAGDLTTELKELITGLGERMPDDGAAPRTRPAAPDQP